MGNWVKSDILSYSTLNSIPLMKILFWFHLETVRELILPSRGRKPSSTGVTSARFTIFSDLLDDSFKCFSSLLKILEIVVKIASESSLWSHNLNFCFTTTSWCPTLGSFATILLVIAVFLPPQDHMLPAQSWCCILSEKKNFDLCILDWTGEDETEWILFFKYVCEMLKLWVRMGRSLSIMENIKTAEFVNITNFQL